ncbi:MAG: hypothetical protein K8H86_12720 [Ignavibacteriaceae bacterium]|nr:hypothetical protein [Ignavibacteriaceae bacterium]
MKILQKLILPVLIAATIFIIYTFYFAPNNTLGTFASFDTNNSANKDIKIKVVMERGIQNTAEGTMFYAVDANGEEVLVQAPANSASVINNNEIITLRGHLHTDYFHAAEIMAD